MAFSGTATRVKSRLLFQPPRDRAPRGSSMADESRGNRQLNVENVLYGKIVFASRMGGSSIDCIRMIRSRIVFCLENWMEK